MDQFSEFKFYRSVGNFASCFKGRLRCGQKESIYLIKDQGKWEAGNSNCDSEVLNSVINAVSVYYDNKKTEVIHLILEEDFLPLNIQVIREDSGFKTAMYEMIQDGTLRFRNCEGAAVELNAE
jgi:hypothetical protein